MKSILQEANSIERAIDKAWNEAGKPKEFTIKVHDEGARSFLGFIKRPAIISILFKPEKATQVAQPRKEKPEEKREQRPGHHGQRPQKQGGRDGSRRYAGTDEQRRAHVSSTSLESLHDEKEGVKPEWLDLVVAEIRRLAKLTGITVECYGKVTDSSTMTVYFKDMVMEDPEEQRMVFASLSYLGMQFLKREFKSRFTGYRIVVIREGMKTDPRSDRDEEFSERRERGPRSGRGGRDRFDRGDRGGRRDRRERSHGGDEQSKATRVTPDNDVWSDQIEFAQRQMKEEDGGPTREEKRADDQKLASPLKKDQKYQPFFVLPEEDEQK